MRACRGLSVGSAARDDCLLKLGLSTAAAAGAGAGTVCGASSPT
jgi:hypothetical protein